MLRKNKVLRIAYNIYLWNKKIKYGQIFVIFGLKLIFYAYFLECLGKFSGKLQLSELEYFKIPKDINLYSGIFNLLDAECQNRQNSYYEFS